MVTLIIIKKLILQLLCKSFGCNDVVEVNKNDNHNGETEYRLRNSWFDHQGILLDIFLITENKITINHLFHKHNYRSYKIDNKKNRKNNL